MDEQAVIPGRRAAPAEVWEAVKDDYLAGLSGPECCRRHGVTLSALRDRAARQGWRRADQPWVPPHALDPWDEGRILEERIGGDLDQIEWSELSHVAEGRMMRAVLRGEAAEVLRWNRVLEILEVREAALRRWAEEEEVRRLLGRRTGPDPEAAAEAEGAEPDSTDDPDSVFQPGRKARGPVRNVLVSPDGGAADGPVPHDPHDPHAVLDDWPGAPRVP